MDINKEEIIRKNEEEILEQANAALIDAAMDGDGAYHVVAYDLTNEKVYTYHTIGWTWHDYDIILAPFQGWGADSVEEEEATDYAAEFGISDVYEYVLDGNRGQYMAR